MGDKPDQHGSQDNHDKATEWEVDADGDVAMESPTSTTQVGGDFLVGGQV